MITLTPVLDMAQAPTPAVGSGGDGEHMLPLLPLSQPGCVWNRHNSLISSLHCTCTRIKPPTPHQQSLPRFHTCFPDIQVEHDLVALGA